MINCKSVEVPHVVLNSLWKGEGTEGKVILLFYVDKAYSCTSNAESKPSHQIVVKSFRTKSQYILTLANGLCRLCCRLRAALL
jgi:hypothetical protein